MPKGIANNIWTHLLVLAALTLLAYANTFSVPFQFDDAPNITNNPIVKDLSYFAQPGKAAGFTRYEALRMRYVGFLTFALNYRFGGLDVTGYHAVNFAVHLLNVFLVYALVMLSFGTPLLRESPLAGKRHWAALLAAALFAVHPVNTQAVTYIVQRFASLAALCYLGAMVCYIKARLMGRRDAALGYYVASVALAVIAMKTKENAFTLPVAIALYELIFFPREGLRKKIILLPLLLTMLIIPLTLIGIDKSAAQVMTDLSEKTMVQEMPRGEYLLTESRVMVTYLRLLAFPVNQNLDYDYPKYSSISRAPVLISLVFIALVFALVFYLYRRPEPAARLASFGIIFFFLALSVESTLVPLLPINEHRLYLPMVGLAIAAAAGAIQLHDALKTSGKQRPIVAICITIVAILAIFSIQRNSVWRTPEALWQDVVRKAPQNVRGLNNLAAFYLARGRYDGVQSLLNTAIALKPDIPETYYNLGRLAQKQGHHEEAIAQYRKALQFAPAFPEALDSIGVSLDKTGQYQKAVEYYNLALRVKPDYDEAYINLGASLGLQGKYEEAEQALTKAISLNPHAPDAYNNLANIYFVRQEFEQAVPLYRRALALNPLAVSPRVNLIKIYIRRAEFRKAEDEIAVLESQAPGQAETLKALIP